MLQKILVALDDSEHCSKVFDEALDLAAATHASLLLLHVLSPADQRYPQIIYPGVNAHSALYEEVSQSYAKQLRHFEQAGEERLRSLAEQAIERGISTEYLQAMGAPGKTICEVAASWNADAIIIGRRGRSGLGEAFLGSVSNDVMHHAPCSVLIVQGVLTAAEALQEYLDAC
jgi:nucleotide-binding universal stress UspA family protein